jgi:hypothetical protein
VMLARLEGGEALVRTVFDALAAVARALRVRPRGAT